MNANSNDDPLNDSEDSAIWFSWTKGGDSTTVTCPAQVSSSIRDEETSADLTCNNISTAKSSEDAAHTSMNQAKADNPVAKIVRFDVPSKDGKAFDKRKYQLHLCELIRRGLWIDFRRRIRNYPSDFIDAFVGPPRTIRKTIATVWLLYFAILLPTVAFSSLNIHQTAGQMGDLRKTILGQVIGGLGFALLGGQPLVIIMTTAPLCLYTKGKWELDVSEMQSGIHPTDSIFAIIG